MNKVVIVNKSPIIRLYKNRPFFWLHFTHYLPFDMGNVYGGCINRKGLLLLIYEG